ncbi:SOS response-associated peptidase [Patescibacteria group bacterium]
MCGRFTLTTPLEEIAKLYKVKLPDQTFNPSFNAAPGQFLPVITARKPDQLQLFKWGLVPFWSKTAKPGYSLINARAESVTSKPSFRTAFTRNRCLVPADGFYEWDKKSKIKKPYRIELKNHQPFTFAAVCDKWEDKDKQQAIKSFSIITTDSNKLVSQIHPRMPVMLNADEAAKWIDSQTEPQDAAKLLRQFPAGKLEMYEVSRAVIKPV